MTILTAFLFDSRLKRFARLLQRHGFTEAQLLSVFAASLPPAINQRLNNIDYFIDQYTKVPFAEIPPNEYPNIRGELEQILNVLIPKHKSVIKQFCGEKPDYQWVLKVSNKTIADFEQRVHQALTELDEIEQGLQAKQEKKSIKSLGDKLARETSEDFAYLSGIVDELLQDEPIVPLEQQITWLPEDNAVQEVLRKYYELLEKFQTLAYVVNTIPQSLLNELDALKLFLKQHLRIAPQNIGALYEELSIATDNVMAFLTQNVQVTDLHGLTEQDKQEQKELAELEELEKKEQLQKLQERGEKATVLAQSFVDKTPSPTLLPTRKEVAFYGEGAVQQNAADYLIKIVRRETTEIMETAKRNIAKQEKECRKQEGVLKKIQKQVENEGRETVVSHGKKELAMGRIRQLEEKIEEERAVIEEEKAKIEAQRANNEILDIPPDIQEKLRALTYMVHQDFRDESDVGPNVEINPGKSLINRVAKIAQTDYAAYAAEVDVLIEEIVDDLWEQAIQQGLQDDEQTITLMQTAVLDRSYTTKEKQAVEILAHEASQNCSGSSGVDPERTIFSLIGPDLKRHAENFTQLALGENIYSFDMSSASATQQILTNGYLRHLDPSYEEAVLPTENFRFGSFNDQALALAAEGVAPHYVDLDSISQWGRNIESMIRVFCLPEMNHNLERMDIFLSQARTVFSREVEQIGDIELLNKVADEYTADKEILPPGMSPVNDQTRLSHIGQQLLYAPYRLNQIFEEENAGIYGILRFCAPYLGRGGSTWMGQLTFDIYHLQEDEEFPWVEIEAAVQQVGVVDDPRLYQRMTQNNAWKGASWKDYPQWADLTERFASESEVTSLLLLRQRRFARCLRVHALRKINLIKTS